MTFTPSRRRVLQGLGAFVGSLTLAGCGRMDSDVSTDTTTRRAGTPPTSEKFWDFQPPWSDWPLSPSGEWQVAGPWYGTHDTFFHPDNAELTEECEDVTGGYLCLTVQGTGPDGRPEGAELEAIGDGDSDGYSDEYSYGYYETRMRVPTGPGVYSFYWIARGGVGSYGPGEIDIEFVTAGTRGNADQWGESEGYVWFVLHPHGTLHEQRLEFNPAADFHRYGFLWTPDAVTWTVDGEPVFTETDPPDELTEPADGGDRGTTVMNAWVGDGNWGGATPPTEDKTAVYDYVWHIPNATQVPSVGPPGRESR